MYRMIIAEPNENERNWVRQCAEKCLPEVITAGMTDSGYGAISLIKEHNPQIVFVSGELLEASGLEIAAYIKEYCPDAYVVVMSTYSCDGIARRVNLDVDKFLLQPFDIKLFEEKMINMTSAIKKKEKHRMRERDENAAIGVAGIFTEFELMSNLLTRKMDKGEILQYKSVLPLIGHGYVLVCRLSDLYGKGGRRKLPDRLELYRRIREIVLPYGNCYIYPGQVGEVICYIGTQGRGELEETGALPERLIYMFKTNYAVTCLVERGSGKPLEYLSESYYEAQQKMSDREAEVVIYAENSNKKDDTAPRLVDLECQIYDSLRMGQDEGVKYFRDYLRLLEEVPLRERKYQILEIMVVSIFISKLNLSGKHIHMSFENYLEIMEFESWEFVKKWSETVFHNMLRLVRVRYGDSRAGVIYQAQDYILDHYTHEISMEEVARLFGVTPQYFSKLFKEKTGVNYVDWVLRLRILKAKELIRYTNITMQDVSTKVGFSDSNYFSRAFKQMEGISPTAYLKKFRITEENPCA